MLVTNVRLGTTCVPDRSLDEPRPTSVRFSLAQGENHALDEHGAFRALGRDVRTNSSNPAKTTRRSEHGPGPGTDLGIESPQ